MKKIKYILCNILLLISALLGIGLSKQVGYFIDILSTSKNTGSIRKIISIFVIYFVISFLFKFIGKMGTIKYSWNKSNDIKLSIIDNAIYSKIEVPTGKILDVLEKDINRIKTYYESTIPNIVYNLSLFIGVFISTFTINPLLALVFMVWIGISIYLAIIFERKQNTSTNIIEKKRNSEEDLTIEILEILRMKDLIYALKNKDYFVERINSKLEILKADEVEEQKFLYAMWIISLLFVKFGQLIILLVGGIFVINNTMTIGELYTIFLYTSSLSGPVESLNMIYRSFILYNNSLTRVNELLSKTDKTERLENINTDIDLIKVENLSIIYDSNKILKNFNINLNRGINLIYGKSGIGKSSLLKVISGIYPISEGSVKYIKNHTPLDVNENEILYIENDGFFIMSNFEAEMSILNTSFIDSEYDIDDYLIEEINTLRKKQEYSEIDKRIINILRAITSRINIIIFDETFARLNMEVIKSIIYFINNNFQNKIIIIVSHSIELRNSIEVCYDLEKLVTK